MNAQPDRIDELVRDWYDRQAMTGGRVHAIRRAVDAVPKRQTRMVAAGVIVALVAMLAITLFLLDQQGRADASRALAADVVRLHRAAGPAPGPADPATLTGLGFTPVVPERCAREGYRVVGARYSTLGAGRAVEVRLVDGDGRPRTLCELSGVRLADLRLGVDGVPVSVWHEGGLVMAMTGGE